MGQARYSSARRRTARLMRRITRADRDVLCRYAGGRLGRAQAMEALGIDWYGDLLVLLARARLPMPLVSIESALQIG